MEYLIDDAINAPNHRREPPQPLGDAVNYFSVSAATPPALTADPHPSGAAVRVKLDNPHPNTPFRTGELVNGRVHVYTSQRKQLSIPKLSLRVYFESRTLYWSLEPKQVGKLEQKLQKIKDVTAGEYETVIRHEVHRGVVPPGSLTLSWDPHSSVDITLDPGGEGERSKSSLAFSFVIPRRMNVIEYSEREGAPRDLCPVERCPPSTLRDWRFGSVQWVVEAIMDLVPNAKGEEDDAMLRLPTESQVLTRLVFPVMPSPEDVGLLRDEPFFGNDPVKDRFGSRLLSEVEVESGKKAAMEKMRARGGTWEIYFKEVKTHSLKYTMTSELYVPKGAQVATDASELPLVLFIKHTGTQSSGLKALFRSTPKHKPVYLRRALINLLRTSSTRGGKEVKAHTYNFPIRQREILFDESNNASSSSSKTPSGLLVPSEENADALELDLTLEMQSQIELALAPDKFSVPAKDLIPSFRTPNFQHEYLLTVSLWFVGDDIERFAARFPLQVVPSDENQLPSFEDVAGAQPPTFTDDRSLPQYQAD